jgi:DNA-binding HxlR family transcriptional regulator
MPMPPSTTDKTEPIVTLFKAIADESRLKILAHLSSGPASVTDLAELTELRPPTVSHHLSVLSGAGLVSAEQRGTTRLYSFLPSGLDEARKSLSEDRGLSAFSDDDTLEAWEQKVLETFVDGESITQIPASEKKRMVLVRWIATKFEADRDYPEAEVNAIIKRHHVDSAYFRRMMVDTGLMKRAHGIYRKLASPSSAGETSGATE